MNTYTEHTKINKNVEWMGLDQCHLPLLNSKGKVQMRHYLLRLFYALDNTPFPNAKNKCYIICWGYYML